MLFAVGLKPGESHLPTQLDKRQHQRFTAPRRRCRWRRRRSWPRCDIGEGRNSQRRGVELAVEVVERARRGLVADRGANRRIPLVRAAFSGSRHGSTASSVVRGGVSSGRPSPRSLVEYVLPVAVPKVWTITRPPAGAGRPRDRRRCSRAREYWLADRDHGDRRPEPGR